MALIKCPDCGKDISDKAPQCIHCGCPICSASLNQSINSGSESERKHEPEPESISKPEYNNVNFDSSKFRDLEDRVWLNDSPMSSKKTQTKSYSDGKKKEGHAGTLIFVIVTITLVLVLYSYIQQQNNTPYRSQSSNSANVQTTKNTS